MIAMAMASPQDQQPSLPPLHLTPCPVGQPSLGSAGGYGNIYRFSSLSTSALSSLVSTGRTLSGLPYNFVSASTRVPYVADASARTLNVILSLLCDAFYVDNDISDVNVDGDSDFVGQHSSVGADTNDDLDSLNSSVYLQENSMRERGPR